MDVDLREALSRGFGPEPSHRTVADRVRAGRRAVRRRRLVGSAVAVAVAGVMGIGVTTLTGDPEGVDAAGDHREATSPNLTEAELWGGEFANYDSEGNLLLRPGATVTDRIDAPVSPRTGVDKSVALEVEHDGLTLWTLLTWSKVSDHKSVGGSHGGRPGVSAESFEEWVAEEVRKLTTPTQEDNSAGYIRFAADGSLVASHGAEILDYRLDPDLPDRFAPDGARTAAALLKHPDGKRFYVLLREVDGLDTDAVPYSVGGASLQEFIDFARENILKGQEF